MDPTDEFFHEPGPADAWSESHYVHFVDDAVQGHGRIGFHPNRDRANVWAFVVADGTTYWIADEAVPPADVHGLRAQRESYTYAHHPVSVGEEWRVEWRGSATRSPTPGAVLAGEGEPATVDVELTFADRHDLFYYSDGVAGSPHDGPDDRYEVSCRVSGSVDLDGHTATVDAAGQRDHSWAPREWAGDVEWLYASGAFDDGTAYHLTIAWLAGAPEEPVYRNGYWFDGERAEPLTDAAVRADPQFGRATAEAWAHGDPPALAFELAWDGGSTTVDVDPFATTPLTFENEANRRRALFNRSAYRQERADGTAGTGWLENPTQFDLD